MNAGIVAVMANPGNMSDANLAVTIIILGMVACVPIILALGGLFFRIVFTVMKWLFVGGLAYLGWRIIGGIFNMRAVSEYRDAFMEAYNKKRV